MLSLPYIRLFEIVFYYLAAVNSQHHSPRLVGFNLRKDDYTFHKHYESFPFRKEKTQRRLEFYFVLPLWN